MIPQDEIVKRRAATERRAIRARETIDVCQRLLDDLGAPALALALHDVHARHARELGEHEIAERAEERYERALTRQLRHPHLSGQDARSTDIGAGQPD